jgi:hypothetical protein
MALTEWIDSQSGLDITQPTKTHVKQLYSWLLVGGQIIREAVIVMVERLEKTVTIMIIRAHMMERIRVPKPGVLSCLDYAHWYF